MTRPNITLASTLERSVEKGAGDPAFIWLPSGEEESEQLSYADLHAGAAAIASELPKTTSRKLAALLYPPGLDFISAFFGCMYAGFIGVPLNLPRAGRQTHQLENILADCEPSVILTTREQASRLKDLVRANPHSDATVIATDEIPAQFGIRPYKENTTENIAYLQYTSGSTGTPKGVVISHDNVLANMEFIERGFAHSSDAIEVSWLPPFHDMGLVYGVLQPVFGRFPCVMMPPQAFVQSPPRWLTTISKYRATHSGGPNFAYELCARSFKDPVSSGLDLSCWRVAFNGAEPVVADTLMRFEKTFKDVGFQRTSFYPAYGLAESTLKVTGPDVAEGPHEETFDSSEMLLGNALPAASGAAKTIRLVGCGQPIDAGGVCIVDPQTRQVLPHSQIGEIWIKGPSVGKGYFKNDEASLEVFHAKIPDIPGDFLRSGDLGFLYRKQLFVTGRLKDLIVIYGRNYHPHDIERIAEQGQAQLKPRSTVAFSLPNSNVGTEELMIVVETRTQNRRTFEELAAKIRDDLAHTLTLAVRQIIGVSVGSLPRTSSGKMKRADCRATFLSGELQSRFVSHLVEQNPPTRSDTRSSEDNKHGYSLKYVDSRILRGVIESPVAGKGGEESSNSRIPFDSITAVQIAFRIEKELGVGISPVDVLECKTVGDLDVLISKCLVDKQARVILDPALPIRSTPIGFSQLSLLYQQAIAADSVALNVSRSVEVLESLDVSALRSAFNTIVARHPILKARFPGFPENQLLEVQPEDEAFPGIEVVAASAFTVSSEVDRVCAQVFDLDRGPLFRMVLITTDSNPIVVFSCHHSICDLWSLSVLFDEFWEEYATQVNRTAAKVRETDLAFVTYSLAEREHAGTEKASKAESYWADQADRNIPVLCFGRSRQKEDIYPVEQQYFKVDRETVKRLKHCASHLEITFPELIFSAFQIILGYYSQEKAFWLGTSIHARHSVRYERALGCMMTVLPVVGDYDAERSLQEAASRAAKELRQAVVHGDYPHYLILRKLARSNGGTIRSGAIEVMFNFYSSPLSSVNRAIVPLSLGHPGHLIDFHGIRMNTHMLRQSESQHRMTLTCGEHDTGLLCTLEYATSLFDNTLIQGIISSFRTILDDFEEHLTDSLGECLSQVDKSLRRRIRMVNDTNRVQGGWTTLRDAFVDQAVSNPDAVALIEGTRSLTYGELHDRAANLAQYLAPRRACTNNVIGICIERGSWAISAILGIIMAGSAYMPIDPEFPDERIKKMLGRASCTMVIVSSQTAERISKIRAETAIVVIDQKPLEGMMQAHTLDTSPTPESAAYVIFTSGSTGDPKGVVVDHRAISNRIKWMQEEYRLHPNDSVLQKTPFTFDVSVWEMFWPLSVGARLILAKPGGHRDPLYLANTIAQMSVSVVHFVPSMLREFLDSADGHNLSNLRLVVCSGEALPTRVAEQSLSAFPGIRLDNLYGPTEAAVDVTSHRYQGNESDSTVPIGTPISNVQVHILDHLMFPVPIDTVGELYLGGIALAQGYVDAPALTAERFVPNPFGDKRNSRLYKTGDLVRLDATGMLHYIGRTDNQIKLRGQRIELGEIEACLRRSARVKDCCVLLRQTSAGEILVAYLLVAEQRASLRKELQDMVDVTLPRYMMPSEFVQLTSFPITANGKVDTKNLPVILEHVPSAEQRPHASRGDELETQLCEIWRDVLKVNQIEENESFFALGGHSLAATQILARVRKQLGVVIPLALMFSEDVTVSSLAGEIRSQKATVFN